MNVSGFQSLCSCFPQGKILTPSPTRELGLHQSAFYICPIILPLLLPIYTILQEWGIIAGFYLLPGTPNIQQITYGAQPQDALKGGIPHNTKRTEGKAKIKAVTLEIIQELSGLSEPLILYSWIYTQCHSLCFPAGGEDLFAHTWTIQKHKSPLPVQTGS